MAKINYQGPAMDAVVAIGGGSLINQYLVQGVEAVGKLVANLPADLMGISVPLLISGAAAMIAYKNWMK